jgi:hypothetical protein
LEGGGKRIRICGHLELYRKFKASLSYRVKTCFKKTSAGLGIYLTSRGLA